MGNVGSGMRLSRYVGRCQPPNTLPLGGQPPNPRGIWKKKEAGARRNTASFFSKVPPPQAKNLN